MLRETVEERETRLQRMGLNQRLRLASETQEERETRLQRMGQRTASETREDRETRFQRMQSMRGCSCLASLVFLNGTSI